MSSVRLIGSVPVREVGERGADFIARFKEMIGWADRAGWHGALIGTSNLLIDPWILAQLLLESTAMLRPLVATQPVYEHPFAVANKASSLAALYDRGIDFNFVAGDHPRDRESLNDPVPHDARYERLEEYGHIVRGLISSMAPTSFEGNFYTVKHLILTQRPTVEVDFDFLMSGTSAAAQNVALNLNACAVQYPGEPNTFESLPNPSSGRRGIRVGIIVGRSSGEAWDAARRKFPADLEGEAIRRYVANTSDSEWVKTLLAKPMQQGESVYWLSPFRQFQRACPYLVGSEQEVKMVLKSYISAGYRTFLIDAVESEKALLAITDVIRSVVES